MADVRRNDRRGRFELWDGDDVVGRLYFHDRGRRRIFVHIELDEDQEGKGFASALTRGALDETRSEGRPVVPRCPYVNRWIRRHDDYADLVDVEAMDDPDS